MDFRSVTGVTIPAGNVNKISIGGVVVWSKPDSRYKILKGGNVADRLSLADFVSKVQDGSAETDYGIGAQIIVPYHDPFDNKDYNLPFDLGTFTAFGEGKLGLQAHYGIPNQDLPYGAGGRCILANSYFYYWSSGTSSYKLTGTPYENKTALRYCLPEDFVNALNRRSYTELDENGNVTGGSYYFFILAVSELYASSAQVISRGRAYGSAISDTNSYTVWEYWADRIGSLQDSNEIRQARISYALDNTNTPINTISKSATSSKMLRFDTSGKFISGNASDNYRYLPACIIG